MGLYSFRKIASLVVRVVVAITVLLLVTVVAIGQTKPERQSKATKAAEAKPGASTSQPEAKTGTDNEKEEPESAKPEDKPFKGMKYRLIGPFRGGRSLTAAGIPGDPTTYYFGSTGGGVLKG